jgi:hypothetical protein
MLSIFTASTRFSEATGSPVNGDRSSAGAAAFPACPPPRNATSAPATSPAKTTTATTMMTALCRAHIMTPSGLRWNAHLLSYNSQLSHQALMPTAGRVAA